MKLSRFILLVLFLLVSLTVAKEASANIPRFSGHVYYANPDGTKTQRGIANIYIRWSDKANHNRYTKTDNNGEFNFEANNPEEKIRRAYRTWIKPDQPEIPPLYDSANPDKDLSSQGYTRLVSIDLYEQGLSCSDNSHQFSVIRPLGWSGQFIEAETNWSNDDGNAITNSTVINPLTVGNVNFNNSQNWDSSSFVANFYYKPNLIAGQVISGKDNKPVAGVTAGIYKANGDVRPVVTGVDGRFQVAEFISKDELYAVRVDKVPEGYKIPPKTTTSGWTKRQTAPAGDPNTPLNSASYELQKFGDSDCADFDKNPARSSHESGRCNFQIDPAPAPTNTPVAGASSSPSSAPGSTVSPVPSPSAGTADGRIGDAGCLSLPVGHTVTGILIDSNPLSANKAETLTITLQGSPGQSDFILPILINYSNNACRIYNLGFKYNIGANKPFIKSQGGDVHSNVKIEQ